MEHSARKSLGREHPGKVIVVDAYAPNPETEHAPLPEQILGFALDQRASDLGSSWSRSLHTTAASSC